MPADRNNGAQHERAIASLADEASAPIAEVAQRYEDKWAALQAGARITGFLAILTIRNVRERLRQRSDFPAGGSTRDAVGRGSA